MINPEAARPTLSLAVWRLTSCAGCHRSVCETEQALRELAGRIRVEYVTDAEAAVRSPRRYDVSLVEGSVTTSSDVEVLRGIRQRSRLLVTVGACASVDGIQALRGLTEFADLGTLVYPGPEPVDLPPAATAISEHVPVDHEVHGCPVERGPLLRTLTALLSGRRPELPVDNLCVQCRERGLECVLVTQDTYCLGPVTRAGCGAICPSREKGCYGCFGPLPGPRRAVPVLGDLALAEAEFDEFCLALADVDGPGAVGSEPDAAQLSVAAARPSVESAWTTAVDPGAGRENSDVRPG